MTDAAVGHQPSAVNEAPTPNGGVKPVPANQVVCTIRCLACKSLKGEELRMGRDLVTCARFHFRNRGTHINVCFPRRVLLDPPPSLVQIAAGCVDFEPHDCEVTP